MNKVAPISLVLIPANSEIESVPRLISTVSKLLTEVYSSDFVFACGIWANVKEFAEASFAYGALNWHDHVEVDQKCIRPTKVIS